MSAELIRAGEVYNSLEVISIASKALAGANRFPIRVRPFEKCLWVKITDSEVTLAFETFKTRESRTRVTFLKQGLRTVTYSRATGEVTEELVLWMDAPPEVSAVANYGVRDERETREREAREALAHRVGTARVPLDSFGRVVQADTTDRMKKHWA